MQQHKHAYYQPIPFHHIVKILVGQYAYNVKMDIITPQMDVNNVIYHYLIVHYVHHLHTVHPACMDIIG